MNYQRIVLAVAALLLVPSFVNAGLWNEQSDGGGDAGELIDTALTTAGSGVIMTIEGVLAQKDSGQSDVDMFKIEIFDNDFTAVVSDAGQEVPLFLYLFSPLKTGVAANTGTPPPSLPSLSGISGLTTGDYYLAISYLRLPQDISGNDLFTANDDPVSNLELHSWFDLLPGPLPDGEPDEQPPAISEFVAYTIQLEGARFADQTTVPEPTSLAVMGLVGFIALRSPRRLRGRRQRPAV